MNIVSVTKIQSKMGSLSIQFSKFQAFRMYKFQWMYVNVHLYIMTYSAIFFWIVPLVLFMMKIRLKEYIKKAF